MICPHCKNYVKRPRGSFEKKALQLLLDSNHKSFTVQEITDSLDVDPTVASHTLRRLFLKGQIHRTEGVSSGGRRPWLYSMIAKNGENDG